MFGGINFMLVSDADPWNWTAFIRTLIIVSISGIDIYVRKSEISRHNNEFKNVFALLKLLHSSCQVWIIYSGLRKCERDCI